MMLYPPVAELVEKTGSRYQLVTLVAKRARTIAQDNQTIEDPAERSEQKPVSQAIEEVYTGKLTIKQDSDSDEPAETAAAEEAVTEGSEE